MRAEGHGLPTRVATAPQDRLVVTVSWDRCIHVYSAELELMRKVIAAHDGDIVGLAVSRSLSLIATSSDDGMVALWDLQVSERGGGNCGAGRVCLVAGCCVVTAMTVAAAFGSKMAEVRQSGEAGLARRFRARLRFRGRLPAVGHW